MIRRDCKLGSIMWHRHCGRCTSWAPPNGGGQRHRRECGRATSLLDDRHGAGPAGGRGFDLHREAGDREAVRRAAPRGCAASRCGSSRSRGRTCGPPRSAWRSCVSAYFLAVYTNGASQRPGVRAGDRDAARGEIERRLPAHAAAGRHVVGLAVARARARVDHHDVERRAARGRCA